MVKDQRKLDISKLPAAKLNKILAEDSAAAPAIGGVVPIFLLGIFLAATMALPVYIFSGAMFDLSLEENILMYVLGAVVAAGLLGSATLAAANDNLHKLAASRGQLGGSLEMYKDFSANVASEAMFRSVAMHNTGHLAMFWAIALHLGPLVTSSPAVLYLAATVLPAALQYMYAKRII